MSTKRYINDTLSTNRCEIIDSYKPVEAVKHMLDSQTDELEEIASEVSGSHKSDYLYPLPENLTQQSQLDHTTKLPRSLRIGAVVLLGVAYLMMAASLFDSARNGLMNSIAQNHLQNQSITAVRQPIKTHS